MKKFFYSVLAAATMLFATTSCSSEEEIVSGGTTQSGTTQKVKFSVQLPDQSESRAIADGVKVGQANKANTLAWALYESTKVNESPVATGEVTKEGSSKEFTASIDMVKGLEYKILFFAYDKQGTIFDVEQDDDLKTLKYRTPRVSNVEAYDAFTACHTHKVNDENVTTVTLYRPFAQINAATSNADLERARQLKATVVESELILNKVPTQYNVLTGEVSDYELVTYTKNAILTQWDEEAQIQTDKNEIITVENKNYNYLNMVYVLAGEGTTTSSTTDATFNFYRANDETPVRSIDIKYLPIQRNYRTNVIGDLLTQTENFKIVIDNEFEGNHNILEGEVVPVANFVDMQTAIDEADGPTVIKLTQDFDGTNRRSANSASITIVQKEGTDLVIDGCGYKFNGTIYIYGQSRHTDNETLTFKNIKFEGLTNGDYICADFRKVDDNIAGDETVRYAHNVTVENCTFSGSSNGDVVGMRFRQAYNIIVKNVEAINTDMFSLLWATGCHGIELDNTRFSGAKEGITFGQSDGILVRNSEITADVFGLRADGDANNYSFAIENSTINAQIPVVVRSMTGKNYKLDLENSTLNNTGKYHVVFTAHTGFANNNSEEYVAPTGTYTITGADDYIVYPRDIVVSNIDELQAALNSTKSVNIKFGENLAGNVTVLQKEGVDIVIDGEGFQYDGVITVNGGARSSGKETLTFKNIKFSTASSEEFTFISAPSKINGAYNYSHNVTFDNCDFEYTGNSNVEIGSASFTGTYNFVMKNCTATNMHSILQAQSCDNKVLVDNVTTIGCKNGLSFGNTAYPTLTNSRIEAIEYGVRGDGDASRGNLIISNTTINAKKPVIIRKVTTDYNVALEGENTLSGAERYDVVFTNGDDDEAFVAPTGTYSITGAEDYNVYPREVLVGNEEDLTAALKGLKNGSIIKLTEDITITTNWDARYTGAKTTVPVVIDGQNHTLKFENTIDDKNYFAVFRFENNAEVKNLNFDLSEAVGTNNRFRAISAKSNLIVDNCTFIGNPSVTNTRGIIFGEGAGASIKDVEVLIKNCTFTNWRRGVIDNENAQDAKSVTIEGNTFSKAPVYVSAYENITFVGNIMKDNSEVNIKSYTSASTCKVKATGNTLDGSMSGYNVIGKDSQKFNSANVEAQNGFTVYLN